MGQGQGQSPAQLDDRYFVQKVKLGQGSFGTVWRAVDRRQGHTVAIKQLDKASLPRRGVTRQDIEREISLMRACKHENITQLFDTFEDERSIYLALEYCEDGDFGDKVKERGMAVGEAEVAEWTRQMCASIGALHARGILHRDIKPDNFMVSGATLKLSDFGLAVHLPHGRLLQERCGTPAFMAPEQHLLPGRSRGYGFPADVWAAGVSMYMCIFGGRHPFLTERGQLDERALLGSAMDFRDRDSYSGMFAFGNIGLRFSDDARKLCKRMADPDPSRRPTMASVLHKPWLMSGIRRCSSAGLLPPAASERGEEEHPTALSRAESAGARLLQPSRANSMDEGSEQHLRSLRALEEEAAKLRAELEQRRRKEEELELQTRTLQEQHALLQQQRSQEMELKNERMREQELQLQQAEREKQELVRQRSRSLEADRRSRWASAAWPGQLGRGAKCRYESGTYGWLAATVQDFNDRDSTYNLSVRPHAVLDRIAPPPAATAREADAWPEGTLVQYLSASANQWLPAVVTTFNPRDGTYDLDVRDHADPERIRARAADGPVSARPAEEVAATDAAPATSRNPRATPCSTASTSASSTGARAQAPKSPSPSKAGHVTPAPSPSPPSATRATRGDKDSGSPAALAPRQVSAGDRCVAPEHGLVLIEALQDGMATVRSGGGSRTKVAIEALRAPGEARHAWAAGTKVAYQSATLSGRWIDASIISFSSQGGTYNLDVRAEAAPESVRPR